MIKRYLRGVFTPVIALSLILAACTSTIEGPTTEPVAPEATKPSTQTAEPTPAPVELPTEESNERTTEIPTEEPAEEPTQEPLPRIDPSGQIIRFWHIWGEGLPNDTLLAMVNEFNSTNEWGITVQAIDQGGYSKYEEIKAQACAASEANSQRR